MNPGRRCRTPRSTSEPMADSVWGMSYHDGPLFIAAGGKGGIQPHEREGLFYGLDTSITTSSSHWGNGGTGQWDYSYHNRDYRCVVALGSWSAYGGSWGAIVQGSNSGSTPSSSLSSVGFFTALLDDGMGTIWAGNDSMGIFRKPFSGGSWTPVNTGPTNLRVLCLAATSGGLVFAGTRTDGVFRTSDGGVTWSALGLAGRRVQALAVGPGNRVYAGLSDGLSMSNDAGDTWGDASWGLASPDIRALTVAPDGRVYCGTWGDGVYRMIETRSANLVKNPSFEVGTDPWKFYTSARGTFAADGLGPDGSHAGHGVIRTTGSNVQVYQSGIPLKAGVRYRLSFKAYSTTGHLLQVFIHKHGDPYTDYGLDGWEPEVTTSWKTFSTEFTAENFADSVNDARLRFWLSPYAQAGDQYFLDDVDLEEVEPNLLVNGRFEWGVDPWKFYADGGGSIETVGRCRRTFGASLGRQRREQRAAVPA